MTPAYDLIFCKNAYHGNWMLVNGKRSGLRLADFQQIGGTFSIAKPKAKTIIEQVCAATTRWNELAEKYGVLLGYAGAIGKELAKLRDSITDR